MLRAAALLMVAGLVVTPGASEGIRKIGVTLELSRGNSWGAVDPQTVFRSGDEVRFRFQSSFSGFLYVLDQPATGEQKWLFPAQETGSDNAVLADREYLIPAEGAFGIPDKPGYETVFWIVSELPLAGLTGPPVRQTQPLRPLLPRCRDLGSYCRDGAAGPRPVTPQQLPSTSSGPLRARDITLNRASGSATTNVSVKGPGPVIYEIRIAHQ